MSAAASARVSSGAMNVIVALLEQRTGQQIAANRAWRVETALKPVLRRYQFDTLDQLVAQIVSTRNSDLTETVVDALLNQETSFYRDAGVIDGVFRAAQRMQADNPTRRLRIWCAGCSTGQEPLSLAMQFAEQARENGAWEPEIVATDVSPTALRRASEGRYSQFEIQRGLPVRKMVDWFDSDGSDWAAHPGLVRRIKYRRHNLAADAPPAGRFDIVLCRNVLLYFSPALRTQVLDKLAAVLRPGGVLVLGAGETVIGQTRRFVTSEEFRGFYRVCDPEMPARLTAAAG